MSDKDGGPAFPYTSAQYQCGQEGMTLLDYFAAKAMQGLIADRGADNVEDIHDIASDAYSLADAMIAERSKP